MAVPVLASAAVAGLAFTSAPLDVYVDGVRTSQATLRLDAVTVTVHNSGGRRVTPRFMVVLDSSHPLGVLDAGTSPQPTRARRGSNGHGHPRTT